MSSSYVITSNSPEFSARGGNGSGSSRDAGAGAAGRGLQIDTSSSSRNGGGRGRPAPLVAPGSSSGTGGPGSSLLGVVGGLSPEPFSPMSPVSPMMASPRNAPAADAAGGDSGDLVELDPVNPCFPTRSSLTQKQMDKMREAVLAKQLERKRPKNATLANAEEWAEVCKTLLSLCDQQIIALGSRVKMVSEVVDQRGGDEVVGDAVAAQLTRAFDAVANCNYIVRRELHKVTLNKGSKPRKLPAPVDSATETLSMLRYLLAQFPTHVQAFVDHIERLDEESVNYDDVLDMKRLTNVRGYLEDCTASLEEARVELAKL